MAEVRHLNNAPITEAIVDIRVKLSPEFNPRSFREIEKIIGERFPRVEERKLFSGHFEVIKGRLQPPSSKDHGIHGFFFRPEVDPKVVQFRVDGFTFSRLKPYTNWEEMVEEAKELWGLYAEVAQPEAVTRLAVRYINHINIPLPIDDLSVYLTAPPSIPDGMNGVIGSFLSKIVVYDQDLDVASNIVQALEKSAKPEKYITIVLDIDSYKGRDFNQNSDEMWNMFDSLHDIKNQIFFTSITEETARLFE